MVMITHPEIPNTTISPVTSSVPIVGQSHFLLPPIYCFRSQTPGGFHRGVASYRLEMLTYILDPALSQPLGAYRKTQSHHLPLMHAAPLEFSHLRSDPTG